MNTIFVLFITCGLTAGLSIGLTSGMNSGVNSEMNTSQSENIINFDDYLIYNGIYSNIIKTLANISKSVDLLNELVSKMSIQLTEVFESKPNYF